MQDLLKQLGMAQMETGGKGRDDDVTIQASQGEYVIPADVVAALGDGNTEAGAKALDSWVQQVRSYISEGGMPNDGAELPA